MSTARGRAPAVVDGELQHVSVSQIMSYDDGSGGGCPRAWWYDKVARVPRVDAGAWQSVGTLLHSEVEDYLTGRRTSSDLSALALAGVPHLPEPSSDLLVEHPLVNPGLTAAGVPFEGYVDWLDPRDPEQPHVGDNKTTKSIRLWAKTPEQLATNVQAAVYSHWARLRYPTAKSVKFSHVYFETTPLDDGAHRSCRVENVFKLTELDPLWLSIERTVERMKATARETRDRDVTPNTNHCRAYGGCPYAKVCPHSPANRRTTENESLKELMMGLLNNLTIPAVESPEQVSILPPDAPVPVAVPTPATPLPPAPPEAERAAQPDPLAREKKRGRPKKYLPSNMPPQTVDRVQELPPTALAAAAKAGFRPVIPPTTETPPVPEGLTLYVNCVPNSFHIVLNARINELAAQLAKEVDAPDVRLAANDSPLGYGKWKAALAQAIVAEGCYGDVVVHSGDLADPVIDVLRGKATKVVVGVR
jgi:hypothetical protein